MSGGFFIDANILTKEMISAGGDELSSILCALDVDGVWNDRDVIPDVFRAMVAVAPRVACGCLQQQPEDRQQHQTSAGEPDCQLERTQE